MTTSSTREQVRPDISAAASWRRLTIVGLFTLPVVFIATQVVNEVVIPPLIVFGVIAVCLGSALIAGKGNRVLYGAMVLGIISVLGSARFLVADLSHPETGAGFVVALMALMVGLGAAIAAVFATRDEPPNGARVVAMAAGGVLVLGTVASLVITLGVEDHKRRDGDIVVASRDTTFPEELVVPAGTVAFFVENEDVYRHTILIEGVNVKVELPGSTDRRFETELDPGEYRYFCDVPGHESMEGTLIVK